MGPSAVVEWFWYRQFESELAVLGGLQSSTSGGLQQRPQGCGRDSEVGLRGEQCLRCGRHARGVLPLGDGGHPGLLSESITGSNGGCMYCITLISSYNSDGNSNNTMVCDHQY